MNIIEIIRARKSIRTYAHQPLSEAHYELIKTYLKNKEQLRGPFENKVTCQCIVNDPKDQQKSVKIGSYGIIKNPQGYIVGRVKNSKEGLLDFGYVFEKIILELTAQGIGTCWLGGTFNRQILKEIIQPSEEEIIPCITPIGYPNDKKKLIDKTMRYIVKADHKKDFSDHFYLNTFDTNLKIQKADGFGLPMEMVRLGPSASNKQPWRLVLTEDKKLCHFYLEHTPNYVGNKFGFDMQMIDMGIAMSHFELSCKALNMQGHWICDNPNINLPNTNIEYIVSWQSKE